MDTITIPKKEYNILKKHSAAYIKMAKKVAQVKGRKFDDEEITEDSILQLAREAKRLSRAGKLALFKDLIKKEYPELAHKYALK